MKRIFTLSVLISLISISCVSGQTGFRDGFIVTDQHDTIFGRVAYRLNATNYQVCSFKAGDTTTDYAPSQIAGFGYTGDKFFSSGVLKNRFVEVLVEGDMSLYRHKRNYYVKKLDGGILKFETKNVKMIIDGKEGVVLDDRWKKFISSMISDCDADSTRVLHFSEKAFTKIVSDYNKCREADFIIYKENKPWIKADLGVMAGLTKSSIRLDIESKYFLFLKENYTDYNPSIGLMFGISFPRTSERIALQSEIQYVSSSYQSFVATEKTGKHVTA